MTAKDRVVINLATGLEDAERVTVAFLVATAAVARGKNVVMFLTKEAVRLGLPGGAEGVACDGCPPLSKLSGQYAEGGGELLVCPICFSARKLDEGAPGREREARWRDAALGVDRRRRDRVQLLIRSSARHSSRRAADRRRTSSRRSAARGAERVPRAR